VISGREGRLSGEWQSARLRFRLKAPILGALKRASQCDGHLSKEGHLSECPAVRAGLTFVGLAVGASGEPPSLVTSLRERPGGKPASFY
jgi:hypothetical protein